MAISHRTLSIPLSALGIIILIVTIIFALSSGADIGGKKAIVYDKKIISALQNISQKVPYGERIISPNFTPIVMYFTERMVYTPYSANSYPSLLSTMDDERYKYLLVFENQSDIDGLKQIFKKEELPKLGKDFSEIAAYNTDFSRLHLFKRIQNDSGF
jgi:hypothetical protein